MLTAPRTLVAMIILSPLVCASLLLPSNAQAAPSDNAAAFVGQVNQLRAAHGLAPLVVDAVLTAKATAWAATMATRGTISHSDLVSGITEAWQRIGENVGVGPDVDSIERAFVASPHHFDNLVDPGFNRIGVGVAIGTDGLLYVAQEFMQLAGTSPIDTPAPRVLSTPTGPARRTGVAAPARAPSRSTSRGVRREQGTTAPAALPRPALTSPPEPAPTPSSRLLTMLDRLCELDG